MPSLPQNRDSHPAVFSSTVVSVAQLCDAVDSVYRRDGWQSPELDDLLRLGMDLARRQWNRETPTT